MFLHLPFRRREFLQSFAGGFAATALTSLAAADAPSMLSSTDSEQASVPKLAARAKSVIFLFLVGGPSQVDSFDYKPILQSMDRQKVPDSFRRSLQSTPHANVFHGCKDELMASPYRFTQHGQNGMWVSELFPHLAKQVDSLCFLHSMQADSNNHAPASYQLHTGDVRSGKASLGSWVTYGLGSESSDLPGYVVLFDAGPLGGSANYTNGFLPPAFQPTRLRDRGLPVMDLTPPSEFVRSQRDSLDMIQRLNQMHREKHAGFHELDARIASYELAYRMQAAGLEVGDWDQEPAFVHEEYGIRDPDPTTQSFGRKCLLARRLVERGVRFVQIYDMPDKDGWDAHADIVKNHSPRARWTDQSMAALLSDLKRRGLLETTLVIAASEFGRTPMMQDKRGRQHNAAGFTIWLAGGGIKPGLRIGSTDEIGLAAVDRPFQFRDLHATILTALGIPFENLAYEVSGRQERITGVAGSAKPILDILT